MLEWNVFISDFNHHRIKTYNIFNHGSFREYCAKAAKKHDNKSDFAEAVRKELMYYYWSKCEWEIIIQHWPPSERCQDEKVDVYDQVMLNWDVFVDYIWEHRKEL